MTEQTDAPTGGADGADASTVVDNAASAATADDTNAQDTGTDDAGLAEDAGEEPAPKKVPWFQKRINEVTAKVYDKEREAAYWRGIAEGRGSAPQAQTQPEAVTLPTLEDFNYDDAAHAKAVFELAQREAEKSIDAKLSKREREQTESQKNETAIAKLKDGGAKHSDFIAAVSGIPATEAVRDFILSTDNAADVLYELGKDVTANERFNSLSPYQQAIELGRRAATPKATTRTIAPPPPTTVAGLASGMGKSPDQMSMAEYSAWVKERDKT